MSNNNTKRVYHYHSRPEVDPKGKGRRVTVCCIVDNNKMLFSATLLNIGTKVKDTFSKRFGRETSLKRAESKPFLVVEVPEKGIKTKFLELAKEITKQMLTGKKEKQGNQKVWVFPRRFDWIAFNSRKLQKIEQNLENSYRSLRNMVNWVGKDKLTTDQRSSLDNCLGKIKKLQEGLETFEYQPQH